MYALWGPHWRKGGPKDAALGTPAPWGKYGQFGDLAQKQESIRKQMAVESGGEKEVGGEAAAWRHAWDP